MFAHPVDRDNRSMMARLMALAAWTSVAASLTIWGGRLLSQAAPPTSGAALPQPMAEVPLNFDRLFGVDVSAHGPVAADVPADSARFHLLGVVASRGLGSTDTGIALIAIDGKPARAYKVGAAIDRGHVLQSVQARSAVVAMHDSSANFTLTLPNLPSAMQAALVPTTSWSAKANSIPEARAFAPGIRVPAKDEDYRFGTAPNVLLNNLSDMARAEPTGTEAAPKQ